MHPLAEVFNGIPPLIFFVLQEKIVRKNPARSSIAIDEQMDGQSRDQPVQWSRYCSNFKNRY